MLNSRTVTIGVLLALFASSACADTLARGSRARRAPSPTSAPMANNGHYVPNYDVPYVVGVDGKKHSVMEIPGSVTVIPRQVMDDQQVTTIGGALRNAAGVTVIGR